MTRSTVCHLPAGQSSVQGNLLSSVSKLLLVGKKQPVPSQYNKGSTSKQDYILNSEYEAALCYYP